PAPLRPASAWASTIVPSQVRAQPDKIRCMRAVIVGSGSEIPPTVVTNQMLSRIMDTSDAWIRERSGVETRYFVEPGTATSDLGVAAARKALEHAQVKPEEIDLVVFATMTPDHYFPGCGGILQAKLGLRPVPCFDI